MAILILIFIYSSLSLNERIIEFTKIEKSRIEFTFFVLQASLSSSLFSKEISNFLSGTHKIPSLSFALFINNKNRFSVKCQHFTEASVSQACRTYYIALHNIYIQKRRLVRIYVKLITSKPNHLTHTIQNYFN